jgi:hypothetical protein
MAQQWEVQSPTGRCSVTGRALAENDEFYAVLFPEGEGFRREDYSLAAWQGPPEGSFCFFKSRVPVREKKKRLLVDNDILFNFFTRLASETEPARIQFRFVLALILMRKRLLRYEGMAVEEGVEVWRMVQPGQQTEHKVINPRLTDDQIEGVSRQLSAILHGDMGEWGASQAATADELEPADD